MGLFTNVIIHPSLLPKGFKHYDTWQTKDVVDPSMETLEVTEDGKLIYHWNKYSGVESQETFLGFRLVAVEKYHDILDFHGDMVVYVFSETDKVLVEFKFRFTDGCLTSVTKLEKEKKMKLWEFVPEFIDALIEHLKADDERWGDTWLKRTREGQEERMVASTNNRFDKYLNGGQPLDWLAIAGDAFICWLRERHEEIWPE